MLTDGERQTTASIFNAIEYAATTIDREMAEAFLFPKGRRDDERSASCRRAAFKTLLDNVRGPIDMDEWHTLFRRLKRKDGALFNSVLDAFITRVKENKRRAQERIAARARARAQLQRTKSLLQAAVVHIHRRAQEISSHQQAVAGPLDRSHARVSRGRDQFDLHVEEAERQLRMGSTDAVQLQACLRAVTGGSHGCSSLGLPTNFEDLLERPSEHAFGHRMSVVRKVFAHALHAAFDGDVESANSLARRMAWQEPNFVSDDDSRRIGKTAEIVASMATRVGLQQTGLQTLTMREAQDMVDSGALELCKYRSHFLQSPPRDIVALEQAWFMRTVAVRKRCLAEFAVFHSLTQLRDVFQTMLNIIVGDTWAEFERRRLVVFPDSASSDQSRAHVQDFKRASVEYLNATPSARHEKSASSTTQSSAAWNVSVFASDLHKWYYRVKHHPLPCPDITEIVEPFSTETFLG